MKAVSDTTIQVTLTSDEVQQALLDWVRKNHQGSEALHLVIRGVSFKLRTADSGEAKTDDWPGETTLLCGVQRPAGLRAFPQRCGAHFEGVDEFGGSDF